MRNQIKILREAWKKSCCFVSIFFDSLNKDVNERSVKILIQNYLEENSLHEGSLQLHHIAVATKTSKVVVTVTLGRPGILIGRGGATINEIERLLSERLEKPVHIEIVEHSVWA